VSSVLKPVGPEEPGTYWRRRAAVLGALVLVLLLLWWLVGALFGSGDDAPATDQPSPTPSFGISMTPDGEPTPSPSGTTSASPSPSGSPVGSPTASAAGATASASPTGACADSDVRVLASTATTSTPVGAGMRLTMSVTNTGTAPCTRDVGAGANELRITSGSVVVWSSDYCNPSTARDAQVLVPNTPWSTSITWPGTITSPQCPSQAPKAQAGSYRVTATNGALTSPPVPFTVG